MSYKLLIIKFKTEGEISSHKTKHRYLSRIYITAYFAVLVQALK